MKKYLLPLLVLLFIPMSYSDFSIEGWYPVEEWEIKVCSRYGGTAEATSTSGAVAGGDAYMFKTTVTIQGLVTKGDSNLYEIAWYLRPMQNAMQYTVQLFGPDGVEEIYKGSASVETGASNYHAMESEKEYLKARITYDGGYLLVPIIEK